MLAIAVGQAILPAAAFQAARRDRRESSCAARRRLKAGGSHDWLPHRAAEPQPSVGMSADAARTSACATVIPGGLPTRRRLPTCPTVQTTQESWSGAKWR
jgi:hypothetical protein